MITSVDMSGQKQLCAYYMNAVVGSWRVHDTLVAMTNNEYISCVVAQAYFFEVLKITQTSFVSLSVAKN